MYKWKIEKYAKVLNKKWNIVFIDKGYMILFGCNDYLFLMDKSTVVEKINLSCCGRNLQMKIKDKTIGFFYTYMNSRTIFKVCFQGMNDALQCIQLVSQVCKNSSEKAEIIAENKNRLSIHNYESASSILKSILEKKSNSSVFEYITSVYPLESAIRFSILDPAFPEFVDNVEKILNRILINV